MQFMDFLVKTSSYSGDRKGFTLMIYAGSDRPALEAVSQEFRIKGQFSEQRSSMVTGYYL